MNTYFENLHKLGTTYMQETVRQWLASLVNCTHGIARPFLF